MGDNITATVPETAAAPAPVAAPVQVLAAPSPEYVSKAVMDAMAAFAKSEAEKEEKARQDSILAKYLLQPKTTTEVVVAYTLRTVLLAGAFVLALYAGHKFLGFVKDREEAAKAASAAGTVLGD